MRELASPEIRKLACPRRLVGAVSERSRSGLGACSAPGPLARQLRGFAGLELRGRHSIVARSGADSQGLNCVAGAALSIGQVQISWQAPHFRKVTCRMRGRCSTFESPAAARGDR